MTANCESSIRIAVLGDVMLDRYIRGTIERISPEAPVPILNVEGEDLQLGGAASVAWLLAGLGVETRLVGCVGDDRDGRVVAAMLHDAGVETSGLLVIPDRITTAKERVLGHVPGRAPQPLMRLDREETNQIGPEYELQLESQLAMAMPDVDVVLISDYSKGVCSEQIVSAAIRLSSRSRKPVIVDPGRGQPFEKYRGCTLLKPNRDEFRQMIGGRALSREEMLAAVESLLPILNIQAMVITLDADGMIGCDIDRCAHEVPAQSTTIRDVTGAGDAVLAVLGVAAARTWPLEMGLQAASYAAAQQVAASGIVQISLDGWRESAGSNVSSRRLSDESRVLKFVAECRDRGETVVLTNGCFDMLHPGHVACLQEARSHGDRLIVAINSDQSVRRLKGPTRPVFSEKERVSVLASLACVDHVVVFDEDTPHRLLREIRPDVLVKGGTYGVDGVVGADLVRAYGGRVVVTSELSNTSTTRTIERIRQRTTDPKVHANIPTSAADEHP